MSERIRGSYDDALYKSTYTLYTLLCTAGQYGYVPLGRHLVSLLVLCFAAYSPLTHARMPPCVSALATAKTMM